jgi:membrane protease YdiL (CAAX protease family)
MASEQRVALESRPDGRSRLAAWAERHALACFFGLTYALSWAIWLTEPLLAGYDEVAGQWFGMLASYSPTLAAMAMATLTGRGTATPAPMGRRLALAGLTAAAAIWASWRQLEAVRLSQHPALAAAFWLALVLLPAWIVFMAGTPIRGLRKLLGSLTGWRQPVNSYLLALLLVPVAGLTGIIVLRLIGDPWPAFPRTEPPAELAYNLVFVFISTILYGGGLAEEPGWRGFALPRLQRRFDPLTASVILSIGWSLWHLPLHFLSSGTSTLPLAQAIVVGVALRLFSILPVTIIYTWLANRTRGNLLLLVLIHASVNNTAGWWLPITTGLYLGIYGLVPVLVVMDRMWRRRR